MGRTLLQERGKYKQYETDSGNLHFEGPNRTVSVFHSGSWCASCQSPESVDTSDRVVYAFASGYPDRAGALKKAENFARKPLDEFDV